MSFSNKKVQPYKEFEVFKSQLSAMTVPYQVRRRGQTYEIISPKTTRKYSKVEMHKGMKNKGYHLCSSVRKQCELYMTMFPDSFAERMEKYHDLTNVQTQCYNEKGLIKHGRNFAYSIDINDCYWKTLYILGYIDWYLFIEGLREDAWKIGRNASIGSLIKKEYIYTYIGKKLVDNKPEIIVPTQEYITIRNHVLTHVWEVFKGLIEILGDDFLMFFTDCVYVSNRASRNIAIEYLKKAGYMIKTENHEIESFDPKINLLKWDCLEDRRKGQDIKVKYYQFNKLKQEITNILKHD